MKRSLDSSTMTTEKKQSSSHGLLKIGHPQQFFRSQNAWFGPHMFLAITGFHHTDLCLFLWLFREMTLKSVFQRHLWSI